MAARFVSEPSEKTGFSRPARPGIVDTTGMYAVIKTGGKQYRVAPADVIEIERLSGAKGDAVAFDQVLMVGGEAGVTVGAPLVDGASVAGEIVDQTRGDKILVFKKRRRQNSKRSHGHRQDHTRVRIKE